LIPAQSSKKRGQRSAVSGQLRPLEPSSCEHRKFFCDILSAKRLGITHRDLFDRVLIAQAQMEDLWLVSNEKIFDEAGVRRYW
jgi:hypothetical protein